MCAFNMCCARFICGEMKGFVRLHELSTWNQQRRPSNLTLVVSDRSKRYRAGFRPRVCPAICSIIYMYTARGESSSTILLWKSIADPQKAEGNFRICKIVLTKSLSNTWMQYIGIKNYSTWKPQTTVVGVDASFSHLDEEHWILHICWFRAPRDRRQTDRVS